MCDSLEMNETTISFSRKMLTDSLHEQRWLGCDWEISNHSRDWDASLRYVPSLSSTSHRAKSDPVKWIDLVTGAKYITVVLNHKLPSQPLKIPRKQSLGNKLPSRNTLRS